MLFALATQGLWLLTTNFYHDFILASSPSLEASSKNSMELLFIVTGWDFAKEGKKATTFLFVGLLKWSSILQILAKRF